MSAKEIWTYGNATVQGFAGRRMVSRKGEINVPALIVIAVLTLAAIGFTIYMMLPSTGAAREISWAASAVLSAESRSKDPSHTNPLPMVPSATGGRVIAFSLKRKMHKVSVEFDPPEDGTPNIRAFKATAVAKSSTEENGVVKGKYDFKEKEIVELTHLGTRWLVFDDGKSVCLAPPEDASASSADSSGQALTPETTEEPALEEFRVALRQHAIHLPGMYHSAAVREFGSLRKKWTSLSERMSEAEKNTVLEEIEKLETAYDLICRKARYAGPETDLTSPDTGEAALRKLLADLDRRIRKMSDSEAEGAVALLREQITAISEVTKIPVASKNILQEELNEMDALAAQVRGYGVMGDVSDPDGRTYFGHQTRVTALAVSREGRQMLSTDSGSLVILRDLITGKALHHLSKSSLGSVRRVCFSHDGMYAAGGTLHGRVLLWDARSGTELWVDAADSSQVEGLAFSPDQPRIMSVSGQIRSLDMTGQPQTLDARVEGGRFRLVTFSQDGKFLASGDKDLVVVWDVASSRWLDHQFRLNDEHVRELHLSNENRVLLARVRANRGKTQRDACAWSLASGRVISQIDLPDGISGELAVSPDGRILAFRDAGGLAICGVNTGNELFRFTGADASTIGCLAFHPDGHHVVAGLLDGAIRMWRIPDSVLREAQSASESAPAEGIAGEARRSADSANGWRTWKTKDGKFSVEARFIEFKNSKVWLEKRDGQEIAVSMHVLCDEDQQYIRFELKRRKESGQ